MKSLLTSLFTLAIAFVMAQTDVYLNIDHFLGNQPFSKQTTATNNLGNDFNVSRLQYYIAEIVLIHDGGTQTPVTDKYMLVNATDSTHEFLGSFNITTLEGIQFGIGVDQSKNHSDPASYPSSHPLAPKSPSMHWGWSAGYRFVAMEGKAGNNMNQTYELHALDDANYFKQTISTAGTMSGNALHIMLEADYEHALKSINVSGGLIVHGSTGAAVELLKNFTWSVFTSSEGNAAMSSEEHMLNHALTVFPNPSRGNEVKINGFENGMEYRVIDVTGQTVLSGTSNTIFAHELTNGMYFVNVSQNGKPLLTEKLIINK